MLAARPDAFPMRLRPMAQCQRLLFGGKLSPSDRHGIQILLWVPVVDHLEMSKVSTFFFEKLRIILIYESSVQEETMNVICISHRPMAFAAIRAIQ